MRRRRSRKTLDRVYRPGYMSRAVSSGLVVDESGRKGAKVGAGASVQKPYDARGLPEPVCPVPAFDRMCQLSQDHTIKNLVPTLN